MHLRLPKMRAAVPPAVLRELDERFNVTSDHIISDLGSRKRAGHGAEEDLQRTFFDDDLGNDGEGSSRYQGSAQAEGESARTMNSGDERNSDKSPTSGMRSPRLSKNPSLGQEPRTASSTPVKSTMQSREHDSQKGRFHLNGRPFVVANGDYGPRGGVYVGGESSCS